MPVPLTVAQWEAIRDAAYERLLSLINSGNLRSWSAGGSSAFRREYAEAWAILQQAEEQVVAVGGTRRPSLVRFQPVSG